jgi:hypothetical protein
MPGGNKKGPSPKSTGPRTGIGGQAARKEAARVLSLFIFYLTPTTNEKLKTENLIYPYTYVLLY